MSDNQIIKVPSVWWNVFQRIAVEVTCKAKGIISFDYKGVDACGYTPIDEFLRDYQPIRIKRRRELAQIMKRRKRVEEDGDLEQLVYERMMNNDGEFIELDLGEGR